MDISSILADAYVKGFSSSLRLGTLKRLVGSSWRHDNGIEYITSRAGVNQKLKVRRPGIEDKTLNERASCVSLHRTKKIVKKLLRDIVGRPIGNVPETLGILEKNTEDGDADAIRVGTGRV